jgi:hypothetical protein
MSITLQLPATIENQLKANAIQQGISLERYALQLLALTIGKTEKKKKQKALTEAELLQRAELSVLPEDLEHYYHLKDLFMAKTISEPERERLIQLNDIIEIAHAERLKYVLELSILRGVSFDETMETLGLKQAIA